MSLLSTTPEINKSPLSTAEPTGSAAVPEYTSIRVRTPSSDATILAGVLVSRMSGFGVLSRTSITALHASILTAAQERPST